jgi:hypothetical protein
MPTRDFEIWLSDTARIVVVFVTARGCVVKFVVRLVVKIKGIWYNVRRYDTVHGTPHIDVLNWRGDTLRKSGWRNLTRPMRSILRSAILRTTMQRIYKDFSYESKRTTL